VQRLINSLPLTHTRIILKRSRSLTATLTTRSFAFTCDAATRRMYTLLRPTTTFCAMNASATSRFASVYRTRVGRRDDAGRCRTCLLLHNAVPLRHLRDARTAADDARAFTIMRLVGQDTRLPAHQLHTPRTSPRRMPFARHTRTRCHTPLNRGRGTLATIARASAYLPFCCTLPRAASHPLIPLLHFLPCELACAVAFTHKVQTFVFATVPLPPLHNACLVTLPHTPCLSYAFSPLPSLYPPHLRSLRLTLPAFCLCACAFSACRTRLHLTRSTHLCISLAFFCRVLWRGGAPPCLALRLPLEPVGFLCHLLPARRFCSDHTLHLPIVDHLPT